MRVRIFISYFASLFSALSRMKATRVVTARLMPRFAQSFSMICWIVVSMIERNSFRLRLSGMKHVQDLIREFPGLPADAELIKPCRKNGWFLYSFRVQFFEFGGFAVQHREGSFRRHIFNAGLDIIAKDANQHKGPDKN